ncbi:hypothetical protein WJX73_006998 [Symbiochloris irregularis]|uniref:Uncharacterized protein n=1 Tax=Symbiochloris irregularis TaxID=706552 RepID=A0AAW1NXI9_9CHLO
MSERHGEHDKESRTALVNVFGGRADHTLMRQASEQGSSASTTRMIWDHMRSASPIPTIAQQASRDTPEKICLW